MDIEVAERSVRLPHPKACPGGGTNVGACPPSRPLLGCWTQPEAAAVQLLQRGRLPEHGIVVGPCLLHRWRSQNPLIPAKVLPVGLQIATHEFLKANEIGSRAFKQGEGQGSTMFPGVGAIPVR